MAHQVSAAPSNRLKNSFKTVVADKEMASSEKVILFSILEYFFPILIVASSLALLICFVNNSVDKATRRT